MAEGFIRISMIREDLERIPQYNLPERYAIRWYENGYEAHWLDIHLAADKYGRITPNIFAEKFGSDIELLAQRQCYLVTSEDRFIGTATAWFVDISEKSTGLVHYVAIVPDEQGRGLARPLMSIILNRLRELGYSRAYLNTWSVRISAINLYAQFGFVPHIRTTEELGIWSNLQSKLKKPFDLDTSPAIEH